MVSILDYAYEKEYLEQIAANSTHMNTEERTQLIGLLKYFGVFLCYSRILGHRDLQP